jgi:hypothetical protein
MVPHLAIVADTSCRPEGGPIRRILHAPAFEVGRRADAADPVIEPDP